MGLVLNPKISSYHIMWGICNIHMTSLVMLTLISHLWEDKVTEYSLRRKNLNYFSKFFTIGWQVLKGPDYFLSREVSWQWLTLKPCSSKLQSIPKWQWHHAVFVETQEPLMVIWHTSYLTQESEKEKEMKQRRRQSNAMYVPISQMQLQSTPQRDTKLCLDHMSTHTGAI